MRDLAVLPRSLSKANTKQGEGNREGKERWGLPLANERESGPWIVDLSHFLVTGDISDSCTIKFTL